MSSFSPYGMTHGQIENLSQNEFPTLVWAWTGDRLTIDEPGTHFGFVYAGAPILSCSAGTFPLKTGMYFAVPGDLSIERGSGLIVSRIEFRGFFHLGGPVEDVGRLRYIDGCTDSLLIPAVTRGDPCLNLLHFPPQTRQAAHTHPSLRAGMVFRGEGNCVTPERCFGLSPGQIFVIQAGGLHSFYTESSSLLVLAYHPDSDFGPTHENHPMINRTIIAGTQSVVSDRRQLAR